MTQRHNQSRKGFILLGVGIVLMLIGIYLGEPQIVAKKSNMICMECIGIG